MQLVRINLVKIPVNYTKTGFLDKKLYSFQGYVYRFDE